MTTTTNPISDRTVRYICVLTRVHAVEAELGHRLRLAAHHGGLDQAQATRAIEMLKQLPQRQK
jgi:hypothetical protein